MPASTLSAFSFVAPTGSPASEWLAAHGASVSEHPPDVPLPATPPGESPLVLLDEETAWSTSAPWLAGWWAPPGSPRPPAALYRLGPDVSPTVAGEIVALALAAHRRRSDLRTVGSQVAHDLMSPLGVILVTLEMLRDDPAAFGDDGPAMMSTALDSGREIRRLIERLSLVLHATTRPATPAILDLGEVFHNVHFRLSESIVRAGAMLDVPPRWPQVLGVSAWIEQIWVELLDNALRHGGPRPEIVLSVATVDGEVRTTLRNTGPRLSVHSRDRLFVPFHSPTAAEGGRWGLTIVERLLGLQGGRAGFREPPEGGAEFWFGLPAVPPDVA